MASILTREQPMSPPLSRRCDPIRPPRAAGAFALALGLGLCAAGVGPAAGEPASEAGALRLRPMSTDRPDRTESPYTVDARHLQVEMDLVSYTRDQGALLTAETVGLALTNLKLGLLPWLDAQLLVETRVQERVSGRVTGGWRLGNALLRLKANLWGNDGGATALGVMPFVALREDAPADAGVIVPLAVALPRGFGLGAMAQTDLDYDRGHHARWIQSLTIGRDLRGPLAGYVELWSSASGRGEPWLGSFDTGLTWALGEDARWDAGVNVGLSEATDDLTAFFGFSVRR